MMNDRRRLKQWELELLWRKSRGRCVICNRKLTDKHADHTVPLVETGRTNVYEMQNLCPSCNLKKGVMSMDDAVRKLRKFEPDMSGYRPDQRQLHMSILKAVETGETEIGVYLHIRGGKSMLQRMLSVHLAELGLCAVALAVNNRAELRRQIVEPDKWLEDFDRLNTIAPREAPYGLAHIKCKPSGEEIVGRWPDDPWPNNEYLLSGT
jgi:HNH endonuclease